MLLCNITLEIQNIEKAQYSKIHFILNFISKKRKKNTEKYIFLITKELQIFLVISRQTFPQLSIKIFLCKLFNLD